MKTLVLDIETTGLVPKGADYKTDFMKFPYIVSLSYKVNGDPTRTFIINHGQEVPAEATAIHGITTERCAASPFDLFDALVNMMTQAADADFIIGHNLYFDTSIIKANTLRMNQIGLFNDIEEFLHKDKRVDTMQKTAKFMGGWKSLSELHNRLFNVGFEAHQSHDDVEACHRCYHELVRIGVLKQPALGQ